MEGEKVAAYLHLEDGTVFKGQAFGSKKSIPGEVGKYVFTLRNSYSFLQLLEYIITIRPWE